ncbi:MAG: PAS domain-containing sensor histidine kinase [Chitinophagaceae bacterium]|nr:PAS domain-containing sensor histidine kinase [Chitinophagaceae bacterium]
MLDQAHMTSLFENATEGIILTKGDGIIVMINPAAEKMFNYTSDELVGRSIDILIPDQYKPHHHQLREGFNKHPSNRSMGSGRDLNGRKKDGSNMPVEVSLSHYRRDDELFVIAFIVNITQRKKIEQSMLEQKAELEKITDKIRQLNAELEIKVEERTLILKEALQKLEESQQELSEALDKERQLNEIKSRFVSMASHEFRTPLTTVLSSASLISKYNGANDQEKREKHIDRIRNSVNNLNEVLEDFLSLGKLNEGRVTTKIEEVNVNEAVGETIEDMKPLLKKGQHFMLQTETGCMANTDKKLLHNILVNLLSNATKFSEENKPIIISTKSEKDRIIIAVADEGIGISVNDQEHLFASFFRAANAGNIQGTGLGLHIVKRYVDILGGEVQLQSELNKGTTIQFTIPCN